MLCDICHTNEATVHLTEIVNDKVTKMHLCEKCARDKGEEMETHFGLTDLLAGLADFGVPTEAKGAPKMAVKCPSCGFTFQDFQRIGRLGCPVCYETFQVQLSSLLKRIHGSDVHMGKMPLKAPAAHSSVNTAVKESPDIKDLKLKLQDAIQREAFEEAAILRDKIRALENSLRKGLKDEI